MSFKVEATPHFRKELKPLAKKYPSLKSEIEQLQNDLLTNPLIGIPLGKGCYKIKLSIASKGRGKSGGARVISYVKIVAEIVYLLSIYDKANQDDISDSDLHDLLSEF